MFFSVSETGPGHHVLIGVGLVHEVRGVGRVCFQLALGGFLTVDDVLFILGLTDNLLSISALKEDGYTVLFRRGQMFIYLVRVGPVAIVLLGDRRDREYIVRGWHMYGRSGWISNSRLVSEEAGERLLLLVLAGGSASMMLMSKFKTREHSLLRVQSSEWFTSTHLQVRF